MSNQLTAKDPRICVDCGEEFYVPVSEQEPGEVPVIGDEARCADCGGPAINVRLSRIMSEKQQQSMRQMRGLARSASMGPCDMGPGRIE